MSYSITVNLWRRHLIGGRVNITYIANSFKKVTPSTEDRIRNYCLPLRSECYEVSGLYLIVITPLIFWKMDLPNYMNFLSVPLSCINTYLSSCFHITGCGPGWIWCWYCHLGCRSNEEDLQDNTSSGMQMKQVCQGVIYFLLFTHKFMPSVEIT